MTFLFIFEDVDANISNFYSVMAHYLQREVMMDMHESGQQMVVWHLL